MSGTASTKNYQKQGGFEWVIGGLLTILGAMTRSNSTPVATGSTIADAAPTTGDFMFVTGADGTKGVLLQAILPGEINVIKNTANAILKVYPNSASIQINGLGAGNPISMAAYTCCDFIGATATQVYTNPLVPS